MIPNFQLSEHFSWHEMTSTTRAQFLEDNTDLAVPHIMNMIDFLKETVEPIRVGMGVRMIVTSGFRCEALNNRVGGSRTSLHLQGMAMDIIFPGLTWKQYGDICEYISDNFVFGKLIREMNENKAIWIHLSHGVARQYYYGIEGTYCRMG